MSGASDVRVIAAYATRATDRKNERPRAVFETDDGLIGLAEGEIDKGKTGKPLFNPLSLADMRKTAERAICGDDAVISHPKTILVLATALVAVLETLCATEEPT